MTLDAHVVGFIRAGRAIRHADVVAAFAAAGIPAWRIRRALRRLVRSGRIEVRILQGRGVTRWV